MRINSSSWSMQTSTFTNSLKNTHEGENDPLHRMKDKLRTQEQKSKESDARYWKQYDQDHFTASRVNTPSTTNKDSAPSPLNIDAVISDVVEKNSAYFEYRISKIFEQNKAELLSGNSDQEYLNHVEELQKSIDGQDYDNARHLLKKFYRGDSDKVISKIEEIVTQTEDKLWSDIKSALGQMRQLQGLTISDQGQEKHGLSGLNLVNMAIKTAKNNSGSLSDLDFTEAIDSLNEGVVQYAGSKLKNAGQNRFSEDAESVTQAGTVFAKNYLLNEAPFPGNTQI